jgi:hypothetical protein
MRRLRRWKMRFGGLFHKQRQDRELDAEIESHIELHVEDNLRAGMMLKKYRSQSPIVSFGLDCGFRVASVSAFPWRGAKGGFGAFPVRTS